MATSSVPPNILFVMTDQQRFDAMSGHGGWIRTPVLDELARTGVDLQRHFAQAPVCVPSRASLFTGRYPHAHRVLENDARLAPHEVHLFKVLKQNGYDLSYTGKNHLLPVEEIRANLKFSDGLNPDEAESPERQAYRQLERASMKRLHTIGSYASAEFHDLPDEVTTTGVIANQARSYLATAPTDRPWCVVASFSDPHVPHLAPRRFAALYPPESLPVPAWDPADLDGKAPRVRVKRDAQKAATATRADQQHYLAVYGAMCSFVDEQIGRVLEVMRARPDADRTLVVFVSDHGDFCWHHGLCKKDLLLYDDLLHVPAILHWPGQLAARVVTETLSEHVDLMPTLLELAGVPVPFGSQGRSLLPWLRGETPTHRTEVHAEVCYPWMRMGFASYAEFDADWRRKHGGDGADAVATSFNVPGDYTKCVRTDRWKYIWFGDGFEELYDLQADPEEKLNRAGDQGLGPILAELRLRLMRWQVESADPRSPLTEKAQRAEYDRWDYPKAE